MAEWKPEPCGGGARTCEVSKSNIMPKVIDHDRWVARGAQRVEGKTHDAAVHGGVEAAFVHRRGLGREEVQGFREEALYVDIALQQGGCVT